jgi:hypothetical protein
VITNDVSDYIFFFFLGKKVIVTYKLNSHLSKEQTQKVFLCACVMMYVYIFVAITFLLMTMCNRSHQL